jgi:tRNA threonylcarbamoyladenosine modification (KEOPS) complex Cgi121 subunit
MLAATEHNYILKDQSMLVKCLNCQKKFEKRNCDIVNSPNHYCSRSCAAIKNNQNPNRKIKKKTKKCKICGELIYKSRQKCPKCIENFAPPDYTLKEAIYEQHHKSSAFALVRSRARILGKQLGLNKCSHCGYDKHVEIAHIKAIKDFSLSTKISTINHPSNIIALCPNCHWEFDHKAR